MKGTDKMYVLIYVDDLLIFGSNEQEIAKLKNVLSIEFKMKDLGFISDFLGINVKQNLQNGTTILSQKNYLENVIKRFNMESCKPMMTPMGPNFNSKILTDSEVKCERNLELEHTCRQIIGCLMYAVSGTRPDICFAISMLSRFQSSANSALLSALKRVLRYVNYTYYNVNYNYTY